MGDRHLVDKQRHQTRRLYTVRSRDAVAILIFGLEALFTRDSRAQLYRMLLPPSSKQQAAISYYGDRTSCYQLLQQSNQFTLSSLSHVGPGKILFCYPVVIHIHLQSSYIISFLTRHFFVWRYLCAVYRNIYPIQ